MSGLNKKNKMTKIKDLSREEVRSQAFDFIVFMSLSQLLLEQADELEGNFLNIKDVKRKSNLLTKELEKMQGKAFSQVFISEEEQVDFGKFTEIVKGAFADAMADFKIKFAKNKY